MIKKLRQVMQDNPSVVYLKPGKEKEFAGKHKVLKTDDANGNDDEVFKGSKVSVAPRPGKSAMPDSSPKDSYGPGHSWTNERDDDYEEDDYGGHDEETINELSKKTLKSYVRKSRGDIIDAHKKNQESTKRVDKRLKGLSTAKTKLKETINEAKRKTQILPSDAHAILKNAGGVGTDYHTLKSDHVQHIVDKAKEFGYRKPATASGSTGRYFHAHLNKIASRLKEETETEEEAAWSRLVEGRRAMPLKGHPNHYHSDDTLHHIAKDAHAAAQNFKNSGMTVPGTGHSTEGKYLDQMHDALTVLHYRSKGGKRLERQKTNEEDHGATHQLRIARKTLKMPDAMVGVMGGPNKKQAAEIVKRHRDKKIKEDLDEGHIHMTVTHESSTKPVFTAKASSDSEVRTKLESLKSHGNAGYKVGVHNTKTGETWSGKPHHKFPGFGEEAINELSKKVLGSYVKKATADTNWRSTRGVGPGYHNRVKKIDSREKNIGKAVDRLTKEEDEINELSKKTLFKYIRKTSGDEKRAKGHDLAWKKVLPKQEETEINELSKKLLGSYARKAWSQNAAYPPDKDNPRKWMKRAKNIDKAIGKLAKEEFMNEESHEARELVLHADNDAQLHRSSHVPIVNNLKKKMKKGTYDSEKAKKLWGYHADRAAQSYHKQHGSKDQKWHHMFSPEHRKEAAAHWEAHHRDELKEEINEISDKTKRSYMNKIGKVERQSRAAGDFYWNSTHPPKEVSAAKAKHQKHFSKALELFKKGKLEPKKEETELDEAKRKLSSSETRAVFDRYNAARQSETEAQGRTPEGAAATAKRNAEVTARLRAKRLAKEDTEINELSKKTLKSYKKQALGKSFDRLQRSADSAFLMGHYKVQDKAYLKMKNRAKGHTLASKKLGEEAQLDEAITNPNSSGQGYDDTHSNHPLHSTITKHGYYYSHSTPIHRPDGTIYTHHTYARGEHKVGVHAHSHEWHSKTSSASGHKKSGTGHEGLDKHLKGKAKRHVYDDSQAHQDISPYPRSEEVISELSKKVLDSYLTKARPDRENAMGKILGTHTTEPVKVSDIARYRKRSGGVVKAVKRLNKEDLFVEQIPSIPPQASLTPAPTAAKASPKVGIEGLARRGVKLRVAQKKHELLKKRIA